MQEWSPFMPLICMFSGEYRALQRSLSDSSQKEGFEPIRGVRREGFQEHPVHHFQPPCATPPLVEFLCPSTSGPFERTWNKDQPSSLYEGLYCRALEFRRLLKQEGEAPQPSLVTCIPAGKGGAQSSTNPELQPSRSLWGGQKFPYKWYSTENKSRQTALW